AHFVAEWLATQVASLQADGLASVRATVAANRESALTEATTAARRQLAQRLQGQGLAAAQAWLAELIRAFGVAVQELTGESARSGTRQALLPQLEAWLQQITTARGALAKADAVAAADLDRRAAPDQPASDYVLERHLVEPSQYEAYCRQAGLNHPQLARQVWA